MSISLTVAILTGFERHFWIHPDLLQVCLAMMTWQQETGSKVNFVTIHGATPVDAARNLAVKKLQETSSEWLLQIDNDVVPPANILSIFESIGERKIVGFPTPIRWSCDRTVLNVAFSGPGENQFFTSLSYGWSEVEMVGAGCLLVHRDVFYRIKEPWFVCSRDEIRHNQRYVGEDLGFCATAKALGFPIWTHAGFTCKHYKTIDLLQDSRILAKPPRLQG